jgi:putative peptidoglycan lipid II flippase
VRKFLLPATLILAVSQLLSRILGVVRDATFAHVFGATGGVGIWSLDTYFAAFRLPDLIYSLLIFGTLSAAFIPLLAEKKTEEEVNHFASNTLNVLFIFVLILAVILFVFAKPFLHLITPGFDTAAITQTVLLLRIQLLAPIFFTISAVMGGLAQHFHKFVWYSLAPILYNGGIIFGAIVWGREFGVVGLSYGVALGSCLHALIQIPGMLRAGFRWQPVFRLRELRNLARLSIPRVIAVTASQLQFIAVTFFASLIGGGALAVFNYAYNLASLPLGVVGVAFATVSFAGLTRLVNQPAEFSKVLRKNILGVLYWVIPSAIGLFVLRVEITQLILARGEFTATDVSLVAQSLAYLAVGIPFFSLLPILNNAFFAKKNTRIPLFANIFCLLITILAAYLLSPRLASGGLSAAYSLAATVGIIFLFVLLKREVAFTLGKTLWKIIFIGVVMGYLVWLGNSYFAARDLIELVMKVAGSGLLGGGFYLLALKFLGVNPRKL